MLDFWGVGLLSVVVVIVVVIADCCEVRKIIQISRELNPHINIVFRNSHILSLVQVDLSRRWLAYSDITTLT